MTEPTTATDCLHCPEKRSEKAKTIPAGEILVWCRESCICQRFIYAGPPVDVVTPDNECPINRARRKQEK
jgi:hypothetical protein